MRSSEVVLLQISFFVLTSSPNPPNHTVFLGLPLPRHRGKKTWRKKSGSELEGSEWRGTGQGKDSIKVKIYLNGRICRPFR